MTVHQVSDDELQKLVELAHQAWLRGHATAFGRQRSLPVQDEPVMRAVALASAIRVRTDARDQVKPEPAPADRTA